MNRQETTRHRVRRQAAVRGEQKTQALAVEEQKKVEPNRRAEAVEAVKRWPQEILVEEGVKHWPQENMQQRSFSETGATQGDVNNIHQKMMMLQLLYAKKLKQKAEQKSSAAKSARPPGIPLAAYGMGGRIIASDFIRAGYGSPVEPVEEEEVPLPIVASPQILDVTCLGIPQRRPDIRDIVGTKRALNARITRALEKMLIHRSGFIYSDPRRPEDVVCYVYDDPLPGFPINRHLRMTQTAMSGGTVRAFDQMFLNQPGKNAVPTPEGRCWILRQAVRLRNYLYIGTPEDQPPPPFLIRDRRLLIDVIQGLPENAADESVQPVIDKDDPLDEMFTAEEFADDGKDEDVDEDEAAGRTIHEGVKFSKLRKSATR